MKITLDIHFMNEERKKGKLEGIEVDYKNKDDRKKYPRTVEDLNSGRVSIALRLLAGVKCNWFFGNNFDEERFKKALSQKLPVICSFESKFSYDVYNFRGGHACSIIGAEEGRGGTIVKLADPHDAGAVLLLPLEELKKHMRSCVIANTDSQTEGMGS